MTTFRKKSTNTYKRYTPVQLVSTLRQLQRQFIATCKQTNPVRGKSIAQQCNAISSEIRKVATILRSKVVKQINVKIKAFRTQMAKNLGVKVSSPKTATVATKRLQAKIVKINKSTRVSTLIMLIKGVKLSTLKIPSARKVTRKKAKKSRRTTRTTRRTRTTKGYRRSRPAAHAKYKRQTKTLKREVHKLKKRNSFMRRLVNQFRKKVAKLQRSYRAAHAKPRWKVVHGRGTSNVVRLNRTTWKQPQRRAG